MSYDVLTVGLLCLGPKEILVCITDHTRMYYGHISVLCRMICRPRQKVVPTVAPYGINVVPCTTTGMQDGTTGSTTVV